MEQRKMQEFLFSEVLVHPELVINFLTEGSDIALMVRREGDKVIVYPHQIYSDEVNEILEEAVAEYQEKKQTGYSKEQAFHDFKQAQKEISKYL